MRAGAGEEADTDLIVPLHSRRRSGVHSRVNASRAAITATS
jgi:hypothetical protein